MEIARYTLSASERIAFEAYCADPDARGVEAVRQGCERLVAALQGFREGVDDTPLIVIGGLPCKRTGDLPTPGDRRNPPDMDMNTEHSIALCAALELDPFGFVKGVSGGRDGENVVEIQPVTLAVSRETLSSRRAEGAPAAGHKADVSPDVKAWATRLLGSNGNG